jgi:SsrA-binding protein
MSLVVNKKIGLTYSIGERMEAGIELLGSEVKTLRQKLGSLEGSRVIIRGGEAFIVGMYVPAYQENNKSSAFDPYRTRKLLLHKKDMAYILKEEESHSLTTVPISLYLKNNLIKCELGICKKLQKYDKRETIKKEIARREQRKGW